MKKIYFILLIISITIIHNCKLLAQCYNCNSMYLNLTKQWGVVNSSLESATFVVKEAGLNTLYDVYLTYSSENPYYQSKFDTFEMVQYFTLPREAAIVDSWLWVDDLIMKAQILDRSTAFNIYEGIVKRRKDPSILYKNNATDYEFRIFPVPYGQSRKVKLSILMPTKFNNGLLTSDLPINLIKFSANPTPVNVISYLKDNPSQPVLGNNVLFKSEISSELGMYRIASFTINANTTKISLSFDSKMDQDLALMVKPLQSSSNKGFFHLQVDKHQLIKSISDEKKKVAILIDHNAGLAKLGRTDIKNLIKSYISQLDSGDLIRIYYNKLAIIEATSGWTAVGSTNFNILIDQINMSNSSQLLNGLNIVYGDLQNDKSAEVVLFSSDESFAQISSAQNAKDELYAEYGELNRTFIYNYANFHQYVYYGNKTYVGNELFYKLLASNSKGSSVHLSSYIEYYSNEQAALDKLISTMTTYQLESSQFFIKASNGICYDIFSIDNGNTTSYFGRYQGDLPLNIEYAFVIKDSIYQFKKTIDNPIMLKQEEFLINQIHVAQKLREMEEKLINGSIETLTKLSLDNRVLSLYTAFLALDPNFQTPCFECIDEGVTVDTEEDDEEIATKASPNPFVNQLKVSLTNVLVTDIESILVYDMTGKQMEVDYEAAQLGNDAEIVLTTDNFPNGIYVVKILIKGKWYILKVIKAS